MRKAIIYTLLALVLGIVFESCAAHNSKKGCDGRRKQRVEMGWM